MARDVGYFANPGNRAKLVGDKGLDPLRRLPDFQKLLKRVGLPSS
jgi:hypothetical protein